MGLETVSYHPQISALHIEQGVLYWASNTLQGQARCILESITFWLPKIYRTEVVYCFLGEMRTAI